VVEISAPVSAEAWIFHQAAFQGAPDSSYGLTTYTVNLSAAQACKWGIEVVARVPSGAWGWYGCDVGTPSLTTLTVKVNGVVKAGVLTKHPWACGGAGEGNLAFSPAQLGCPYSQRKQVSVPASRVFLVNSQARARRGMLSRSFLNLF